MKRQPKKIPLKTITVSLIRHHLRLQAGSVVYFVLKFSKSARVSEVQPWVSARFQLPVSRALGISKTFQLHSMDHTSCVIIETWAAPQHSEEEFMGLTILPFGAECETASVSDYTVRNPATNAVAGTLMIHLSRGAVPEPDAVTAMREILESYPTSPHTTEVKSTTRVPPHRHRSADHDRRSRNGSRTRKSGRAVSEQIEGHSGKLLPGRVGNLNSFPEDRQAIKPHQNRIEQLHNRDEDCHREQPPLEKEVKTIPIQSHPADAAPVRDNPVISPPLPDTTPPSSVASPPRKKPDSQFVAELHEEPHQAQVVEEPYDQAQHVERPHSVDLQGTLEQVLGNGSTEQVQYHGSTEQLCHASTEQITISVHRALHVTKISNNPDFQEPFPPSCSVTYELHGRQPPSTVIVVEGPAATSIIPSSCSPSWGATFNQDIVSSVHLHQALFHLWHHISDIGRSPQLMGTTTVDLSPLHCGLPYVEGWYHIYSNQHGNHDGAQRLSIGQLNVRVSTTNTKSYRTSSSVHYSYPTPTKDTKRADTDDDEDGEQLRHTLKLQMNALDALNETFLSRNLSGSGIGHSDLGQSPPLLRTAPISDVYNTSISSSIDAKRCDPVEIMPLPSTSVDLPSNHTNASVAQPFTPPNATNPDRNSNKARTFSPPAAQNVTNLPLNWEPTAGDATALAARTAVQLEVLYNLLGFASPANRPHGEAASVATHGSASATQYASSNEILPPVAALPDGSTRQPRTPPSPAMLRAWEMTTRKPMKDFVGAHRAAAATVGHRPSEPTTRRTAASVQLPPRVGFSMDAIQAIRKEMAETLAGLGCDTSSRASAM